MSSTGDKYTKKRLRGSYFTMVISISLVLFMLGLLGLIMLHAQKLSDYVKENISVSIIMNEFVKEAEILKLQKTLDAEIFVKSTEYTDKNEAAQLLQKELGEDFISFLGYNPLLSSIDLHLNAEYATQDSIKWIVQTLEKDEKIKEVSYQKSLVNVVNENIRKIGIVILAFSGLLLVIAITLINNSIRLAIYSSRFLIRSMQLVGATSGFIRRPFIWRGMKHGLYSAIIAIGLLVYLIYHVQLQMPELFELQDRELFGQLFGIVIILGIVISWICTFFAVTKYLRMKPENLY